MLFLQRQDTEELRRKMAALQMELDAGKTPVCVTEISHNSSENSGMCN